MNLLKTGTADKSLQGLFIWSHGNPEALGNPKLNFRVNYADCVDPAKGLQYKLGLVIINACDGGFSAGEKFRYEYWDTSGIVPVQKTATHSVTAGGRDLATSRKLEEAGVKVKFFGLKRELYPIGFPNPFGLRILTLTDFKHVDDKFLNPGDQGTKE